MSYYCSYIDAPLKNEWKKLVSSHFAGGFHQSFNWANFQQNIGWDSYKIGIFDGKTDQLIGGAVILEFSFSDGTSFLYIPEGPILDYENEESLNWQWIGLQSALQSIVKINKKEKTTHIRIEPRIQNCPSWFLSRFEKAPINLQPKHTQVVDLTKSEAVLLSEMKQKGRYNINLAVKKWVEVKQEKLTNKNISKFYSLYKQTFTRNKFEGKDEDFFKSYLKTCSDFSNLYISSFEDKVLSVSIVVYYGDRATYLYGASSNENREYMGPYAMHWQIMTDAKQMGYKEYDLWGISYSPDDKEHAWHGITKFKKQFGGKQLDFIGAYDYVIQKDLYQNFIKKHES